jgi:hypothetical protein
MRHTGVDLRKGAGRLSASETFGAVLACRTLSQPQSDLAAQNAERGQNPSWDNTIMTPRWRHTFCA